jgi:hypothetical protein
MRGCLTSFYSLHSLGGDVVMGGAQGAPSAEDALGASGKRERLSFHQLSE